MVNGHSSMRLGGLVMVVIASISTMRASDRENLGRAYHKTSNALPATEALENYRLANLKRIYFPSGKADLTRETKTALSNFVTQSCMTNQSVIELRGYAEGAGSQEQDVALSTARAEATARFLIENGVPSSRVRVIGLGEVDSDKPALNPEHQRVDIRVFVEPTHGPSGATVTESRLRSK